MAIAIKIALSLLGLAVLNAAAMAESGNDPSGIWLTQAGEAKVQVSHCGNAICGTIVWLKSPIDKATGKPQVDDKNPDPVKARRPIIGLHLFHNMKPTGSKWSGRIYNADNGKTYASLSKVAFAITGTRWNGPRFFGLRDKASTAEAQS